MLLTGAKQNDGLETAVFGRVDAQCFELFHLVLEHADVVHESDYSVGSHGTGVKTGGGEEWSNMERHGALSGVEDKQLAPRQPQQRNLVQTTHSLRLTRRSDVNPLLICTSDYRL